MSSYFSYSWAILYGLYFYIVFQLVYLIRFGGVNTSFSVLDVLLVVVGILSVVMLLYFARKLPRKRILMLIPFIIALPFSYIGALGGGLLGAVGILVFGLVPFCVALPVGYWLIKRFVGERAVINT